MCRYLELLELLSRGERVNRNKNLNRHVKRVLLISCIRHIVYIIYIPLYDLKMTFFHLVALLVVVVVARPNLSALRTLELDGKRDYKYPCIYPTYISHLHTYIPTCSTRACRCSSMLCVCRMYVCQVCRYVCMYVYVGLALQMLRGT